MEIIGNSRKINFYSHSLKTIFFFTESQHVATLSFMPVSNHQANDSKINKFTIIVLQSADPHFPDRVEFKHTK